MFDESDPSATLRVRMLGGFTVMVHGRIVPPNAWRQRRAAAIVKLLALQPGHRLHREQLMDHLWPDLAMPDQANNLRQMLHHARRHLEGAGMERGTALRRDGESIVLTPPHGIWVDVPAFERAVDAAWRSLSPASAEAALALYAGDLLPDEVYEEWAENRRIGLRASYLALLTRLGQLYVERGQLAEAIGTFQRLIVNEPDRESAYVALMQLHATLGQREIALAWYDRLVFALARDGLDPESTTHECAQAIRSRSLVESRSGMIALPAVAMVPALSPGDQLIGRERALGEISQLLASARLVTLTGAGGIGKTRLALEIAALAESSEIARHGVVVVDLSPLRDSSLVLPTIAEALDAREGSERAWLDSIRNRVGDQRILLVLDNFEHVASAATDLGYLVNRLTNVTLLVTSRAPLKLRGEREYHVEPLPVIDLVESHHNVLPPAVALFVTRAQSVRPNLQLTEENLRIVSAICGRLGGFPLAIELAAARVRLMSPASILERLDRPLSLLSGGTVDSPERQQTMRKTIQWSVDLLTAPEQQLFAQLSVFAGGWSLDAAEAIVDLSDSTRIEVSVLDGLSSLVEKHLVTERDATSDDVRFGMLETIREYGIEQLEAQGDLPATRDRHAAWFTNFAEHVALRLEGSDQAVWLACLDEDDDNLRASLQWIANCQHVEQGLRIVRALRLHWFMRGRLVEGCDWTLLMADTPDSVHHPSLCADALISAGFFAREYGDYDRAYAASRRALTMCHTLTDRKRAADAMVNLGFVALQRGDLQDARSLFTCVLSTYRDAAHPQGIADAVSFLGLTMAALGDDASARTMIEESIAIWEALDDRQALTVAYAWLGNILVRQGLLAEAYDKFNRALEITNELGFHWGATSSLDGFALIAVALEFHPLALYVIVASNRIRELSSVRPWPSDASQQEQLLNVIREALGDAVVTQAVANRDDVTIEALIEDVRTALGHLQLS